MDRKDADRIADALLEPERHRQQETAARRVRRRWRAERLLWRNRRALRLALAAVLLAAPCAAIVGLLSWPDLASAAGWKRLLLWVGLPAWLFGLWKYRMPPEPARVEEL